jgi:hypothetical protein
MMIAVAVIALAIVILAPVYHRLVWLYHTPPGTGVLMAANVDPDWVIPVGSSALPVGEPVEVRCGYETSLLPHVPSGLAYRVKVEVKLMDKLTNGTVFDSHRETYVLIAGVDSWKEKRGRFECHLTPREPGPYIVRSEIHFTDLFGREHMAASNTGGLEAK